MNSSFAGYAQTNSLYGVEALRKGLQESHEIVYRQNGCRPISGEAFLPMALEAAQKAGITRIARLSELINSSYPVYSSTRPGVLDHTNTGINTGSQGKGATSTQALISCLMETIESYCMEPRDTHLIRGSYRELSRAHKIMHPRYFLKLLNAKNASANEPLLWTKAFCPPLDEVMLVPAEPVFYHLDVMTAETRPCFSVCSIGAAAGATYLDAVIHGLYEVIERKFWDDIERGHQPLFPIDTKALLKNKRIQELFGNVKGNYRLEAFFAGFGGLPKIPMVYCRIVMSEETYCGFGCCFDFDIALERAASEVVQAYATIVSGSREDLRPLRKRGEVARKFIKYYRQTGPEIPLYGTTEVSSQPLSVEKLKRLSGHKYFHTIEAEYRALKKWLADAGYPFYFIANLTRHGVNLPTVKVIVPTLGVSSKYLTTERLSNREVVRSRYRNIFRKTTKKT